MDETSTTPNEPTTTPRRTRMGRKRTHFQMPLQQAASVRALWREASSEEQRRAHELSMAILEYWLGKSSKEEIARRLAVPPVRVWQLSQLALSGMLAGLLRQPKSRGRGRPSIAPSGPENDPRILKQRILELQRKLVRTEGLVRVLKDLPWAPKEAPTTAREQRDGKTKRRARGSSGRRGAQASRGAETGDRKAARARRAGGNAAGAGAVAGRDAAHAALVEEARPDGAG